MKNGYLIIVRDYVAEICEFETITIITMPDNSKLYFIHTKYGDDYYQEEDLSATREKLEKECNELNKALTGACNAGSNHKIYRR